MIIRHNNQPRRYTTVPEMILAELAQFRDVAPTDLFIRYNWMTYAVDEFQVVAANDPDFHGWDKVLHETHYCGVLLRRDPTNPEQVFVGRYTRD